jgi:ISXO2-like transposase domain
MSDEAKAFVAIGRNFAAHETVQHGRGEYARGRVHANSVEGFNLRVQRTVAGVFHHISPEHADLYLHEIGFRWSQRIVEGEVVRRNRHGREKTRTLWAANWRPWPWRSSRPRRWSISGPHRAAISTA